MKKLVIKIIPRLIVFLLAIAMTACHSLVTAPVFFNQGSSAAFNLLISFWLICLIAICTSSVWLFARSSY